jgi:hypothetical protein
MRDDRGPPPVANSRFAAAAFQDEMERPPPRDDRDSYGGRGDDRNNERGAPQQNSRFANAAAMDGDYVDRDERMRRSEQDRFDDDRQGSRGGGGRDDFDRRGDGRGDSRGGRDDYDRRGDGRGDSRGGGDDYDRRGDSRGSGGFRGDGGGSRAPPRNRVDDLLKPSVPVVADNILKAPEIKLDAAHADNMMMFPTKADPSKKKEEVVEKTSKPVEEAAPQINAEDQAKLLEEFASGNKMGDELKAWCEEQRVQLPSVKKLVFHLLTEREKLNPDPDCAWAEATKFGAALSFLVQDDIVNQMQVLWGIQMYCDKLGFPKLNDEYIVQSMFRSMYKFDLTEEGAFMEWKEDEADEHEQGKMKAVIQTVDWFNWLEEEEEEEYEEEEE